MGTKHGEGTYVFAKDGSRLVGQWDRGTITSGEWQLKDGTTFRGEFSRGKPVGGGTFSFPTGIAIQVRGQAPHICILALVLAWCWLGVALPWPVPWPVPVPVPVPCSCTPASLLRRAG